MATNSLITTAAIGKKALSTLHNLLGMTKGCNKDYSAEFARTGAKIGQTINVRLPNRYAVQQGPSIIPQGVTEATTPLTLSRQWVVPMAFSSAERTLSMDAFSERHIQPAMSKLASVLDLDCYTAAITGAYADGVDCPGAGPVYFTIGTPGTTPGTGGGSASALLQYNAPAVYLNAGRILDINAAPRDANRTVIMDPAANAASVGGLSGLFNPQGIISDQYKSGLLGNALGFDFVMSQNVATLTTGTATNGTAATMQATWTTGTNFSWTVNSGDNTKTLKAGQTFTVADCYHVNPETQQSTGVLMQWVVTADTTLSTGTNSIPIYPTPVVAGTGVVNGNCSVAPTVSKAITFTSGSSGVAYPQNLAFHKSAFTLGTADLELPPGTDSWRDNLDGISMRVVNFYDGMSDFIVTRIDVLGGFAVTRPELAVRISG